MKYCSLNEAWGPLTDSKNVEYIQKKLSNNESYKVKEPQRPGNVAPVEQKPVQLMPVSVETPVQPILPSSLRYNAPANSETKKNENVIIENFSNPNASNKVINSGEPMYHPAAFLPTEFYIQKEKRKKHRDEDSVSSDSVSSVSSLGFDKKKCKKYLKHIKECAYCQSKLKIKSGMKNDIFVFLAMGVLIVFILDTFVRIGKKL